MKTHRGPLIAAATALGIGLGGFLDGIVFHQILQAHGMLSAKYPQVDPDPLVVIRNLEINMFWDGMFHLFNWVMTCTGLLLLWKASNRADVPWSGYTLAGGLPLGWGMFNLVEGILDHHILHLHHVRETPDHLVYDLAFLGSGVLLVLVGAFLISRDQAKNSRGTALQQDSQSSIVQAENQ
ncbi:MULTISPECIES: DUF2243 domain-containing protein [unclassified Schlesneria]|uniref:DUF2243 domain-containing protein n=1 Tax=unclassified Schlesneria TaxID=2762017 RepID=UPI002F01F7BA